MPVLIVGKETTFSALRPRLFKGRVSSAVAGRIADALKDANPQVDFEKLRPGTVLRIPELPELRVAALSLDDTVDRGIETLRGDLTARMEALMKAADERMDAATAERRKVRPALDADEVQAAIRRDQEIAGNLEAVREALEVEAEAARARAERLKEATDRWTAELAALDTIRPR